MVTMGDRAFPVAGSRLWNGLPHDVTSASTLPVFLQSPKDSPVPAFLPCRLDFQTLDLQWFSSFKEHKATMNKRYVCMYYACITTIR